MEHTFSYMAYNYTLNFLSAAPRLNKNIFTFIFTHCTWNSIPAVQVPSRIFFTAVSSKHIEWNTFAPTTEIYRSSS